MRTIKNFSIVYYAYLVDEVDVFIEQCALLRDCGIANSAQKVSVCIQTNKNGLLGGTKEKSELAWLAFNSIPKATVAYASSENLYEYPGLSLMQNDAKIGKNLHNVSPVDFPVSEKESVTLYFHTKGIATRNAGNTHIRKVLEENLILNWKNCLNIFENDFYIKKVCLFKSKKGFAWFNFFWVKNSFLCDHTTLEKSNSRWDYEAWIQGEGSGDTVALGDPVAYDDGNEVIRSFDKHFTIKN